MSLTNNFPMRFWLVQIGTVVLIILFVTLGIWQLGRGNIKADIENSMNGAGDTYENLRLPILNLEGARYKNIKLYGKYDSNKQLILDNQVREGVVGYNVFTPFYTANDKKWVLVDRGWIPQGENRSTFPEISISTSKSELQISGSVYVPYGKPYSLGGIADGEDKGWPRRIQFVDYEQIGERLGVSVEPFTMRLASSEQHGYKRNWQAAMMSANKHYGYSFQWFAMAIAVIVLWWVYCIKPIYK